MSVIDKEKFKCPHCNEIFEADMFKSVNVSENKEYRNMLVNGTFFKYKCPKCGKLFMAVYPLIYTDTENKFSIQYTPREMKEDVIKSIIQNRENLPKDFTIRVVDATYDLVEKMLILQNRLDDRAIEACKVVIHKAFLKQFGDKRVNHIYFNFNEKGEMFYDIIFVENEKEMVSRATFDIKLYNQIYHDFRKDFKDDDLIVDYGYGLGLMAKGNTNK